MDYLLSRPLHITQRWRHDHRLWSLEHHLAQLGVRQGEGVHEGLSDDGQTAVQVVRLVHVEHKLGVLQDVHPEPQGQAGGETSHSQQTLLSKVTQNKHLGQKKEKQYIAVSVQW